MVASSMTELPEQVRAFVALKIPLAVVDELQNVQQELKREIESVSWTKGEGMHLTLHFFGNVGSVQLGMIEKGLRHAAAASPVFHLEVRGVGSFGNRVIWAGLGGETERLTTLAGNVRHAICHYGSHDEERAFKGHVTIGRLRNPASGVGRKLSAFTNRHFGAWAVDHVELIRSELSPQGSRYTTLASFPLSKT